jgi:hypothetical protein
LTQRIEDGPRPGSIILPIASGVVSGQVWIDANQKPVVDIEEDVEVLY